MPRRKIRGCEVSTGRGPGFISGGDRFPPDVDISLSLSLVSRSGEERTLFVIGRLLRGPWLLMNSRGPSVQKRARGCTETAVSPRAYCKGSLKITFKLGW